MLWAKIFSIKSECEIRFNQHNGTISATATRVILMFVIVWTYTVQIPHSAMIWGPNGVVPFSGAFSPTRAIHYLSLYYLTSDMSYFYFLYFISFIVAIAYLLGFMPRTLGIVNFILTLSLYKRNPWYLTGGDNVAILVLFFLIFVEYWHVGKALIWSNTQRGVRVSALVHNFALLACRLQVCLMYLASGIYKCNGKEWIHGTAIYYVLQVREFQLPGLTHIFISSPIVVTLVTYATMVFQISFAFVIWRGKLKPFIFGCALVFHFMIAIEMGLVWFSIQMIAVDLLFFQNESWESMWRVLSKAFRTLSKNQIPGNTKIHY